MRFKLVDMDEEVTNAKSTVVTTGGQESDARPPLEI